MTYLRDGYEYLDEQETKVYQAIQHLNGQKRTTNASQVTSASGLSRTAVTGICRTLKSRGFIIDVSKGAAYHWRVTTQPVPYSAEDRKAALALKRRQQELNEQARSTR